jgi:O-antigen/teichoic acid export membrane protein
MLKHLELRSEFTRNVLTLMTGTTIAQAIPIAISPILTRIYTPEDFGILALYLAVSMIFGSIANGRYELAIMLPDTDEDALNVAALGILINVVLSATLMLVVLIFDQSIAETLGNSKIAPWLYLTPVSVFFIGLLNVLNYFNNRLKSYQDIAKATIFKSLVLATVQLLVGFLKGGPAGLVSGQVLSNVFGNLKLLKNTINKVDVRRVLAINKMSSLAIRYQNFPKFSMWAILSNSLFQNLTSILISAYFSVTTLGFYSLVQRMLGMPSVLVGNSVGQVFYQEAANELQKTGKAIQTFDSTVKKLFYLAVPSFGLLFFTAENLFLFVFGENWKVAGTYAMILIPFFAVRFIVVPVTNITSVYEKQRIFLFWQLLLLFLSLIILFISKIYALSFENYLFIFTTVLTLHYVILFIITFFISRCKI